MTTAEIIGLTVALAIMVIGLIGSILPALPSTPLIWLAGVGHRIYFGPDGVATWVLIVMGLLTVLSLILDHLASMAGARRFGSTWRGVVGAVIGGIVGLFFGLLGLVLGPFLGAVVLELAGRRTFQQAGNAGVGAVIGVAVGTVAKLACSVAMVALFVINLFWPA